MGIASATTERRGALCVHPQPGAGFEDSFATLATVVLDVEAGTIRARAGGPCGVA